jgi:hypothetical protein
VRQRRPSRTALSDRLRPHPARPATRTCNDHHRHTGFCPAPAAGHARGAGAYGADGYLRALAAHREAAPPRRPDLAEMDPAIAKAIERQTRAMRRLSELAFEFEPGGPHAASPLPRRLP